MKIMIHAHHVDITDAIKAYVENKLNKLDKFFHNIQSMQVDLDVLANSNQDDRHHVKVKVFASKSVLTASETSKDMYASIDFVFDKLERQLVKHKEKLGNHNNEALKKLNVNQEASVPAKYVRFSESQFYKPKPMYLEDAIMHFKDSKGPVFMFRNAETQSLNVVFQLNQDQIGILEP